MLAHIRSNRLAWLITLAYGVVFCLISLVNHYNFRTYALDMGVYAHGIYCYSHLMWHNFTLGLDGITFNHLGNHFSPILILLSPLYYLFGTYTVLVIQIASILFGGMGVYQFAKERLQGRMPELILVLFFSIWGIYSALAFDFHANVIAAMFVPWFILFFERGDRKKAILMFILVLLCKENMAVWMVSIIAGLAVRNAFTKGWQADWLFTGGLFFGALAYFALAQGVIMPKLNPLKISDHLGNYSHLGSNGKEIINRFIHHPREIFPYFFESMVADPRTFKLKATLHFMVLVSGGLALIYRPHYLVMLASIYGQKMLSSNPAHWGMYSHYSIEFVPIIALAFTEWMQFFPFKRMRMPLLVATICSAMFFNWYPKQHNTEIFDEHHYTCPVDRKEVYKALKLIPDGASVSATTELAPHLSSRPKIYHYPVLNDAEYVALLLIPGSTYPLNQENFNQKLADLKQDSTNVIVYDTKDLLIIKRTSLP